MAKNSKAWQRAQRQQWSFTHYIGDECEPNGHAEHLLKWLRGRISNADYFALFSRRE